MSRPVRGRAILVIEERPYLWAALRQRVEPATAYVLSAAPGELGAVWAVCDPWPWIVVGTTSAPVPGLAERLQGRPIPVHWLGAPPPGLPRAGCVHRDWLHLVDELAGLGGRSLNGVRLLRNRGLRMPDGRIVPDSANVEGLLAAPEGLPAVDETAVRAELVANRLPLDLAGDGAILRLVCPPAEPPQPPGPARPAGSPPHGGGGGSG